MLKTMSSGGHHHNHHQHQHHHQQQQQTSLVSTTTATVMAAAAAATSSASPRLAAVNQPTPVSPPVASTLDVQRIDAAGSSSADAVVMVKLTDEIFAALVACQRAGRPISLRTDEQGGVWELFDGESTSIFRFQKQSLQGEPTDTLVQQPDGSLRNVGVYSTKYTVQATDKSLDETRKRAEKRAVEEKSRGTKHVKQKKDLNGKSRLVATSSTTPATSTAPNGASAASQRSSSSLSSTQQSTSAGLQKPNGSKPDPLRGELLKRTLRKRVVHLVVTQKFKDWEDVYKRIRSDGLVEEHDSRKRVEDLVRDVSTPSTSTSASSSSSSSTTATSLSLKPSMHHEVDPRWPFFSQDEKAAVRRLLATRPAPVEASFAPMRKTGIDRMHAGAGSRHNNVDKVEKASTTPATTTTTNNVSPEALPTPPASRPPSTMMAVATTTSTTTSAAKASAPSSSHRRESSVSDDEAMPVVTTGVKRKAHVPPPSSVAAEKRARPLSKSPPEEAAMTTSKPATSASMALTNSVKAMAKQQLSVAPPPPLMASTTSTTSRSTMMANGGGSTASSRLSSPASSLSSPSQPSCDWEKTFGEIKSVEDAERYFCLFHKEYPLYMDCYRVLIEASQEFRELERRLRTASERGKDVGAVEREIQKRFAHYEKSPEFLRARQQHTDLRSKLAVLKSRIGTWEVAQQRAMARAN